MSVAPQHKDAIAFGSIAKTVPKLREPCARYLAHPIRNVQREAFASLFPETPNGPSYASKNVVMKEDVQRRFDVRPSA